MDKVSSRKRDKHSIPYRYYSSLLEIAQTRQERFPLLLILLRVKLVSAFSISQIASNQQNLWFYQLLHILAQLAKLGRSRRFMMDRNVNVGNLSKVYQIFVTISWIRCAADFRRSKIGFYGEVRDDDADGDEAQGAKNAEDEQLLEEGHFSPYFSHFNKTLFQW